MKTPVKIKKLPKTLGACADLLYTSRQDRLDVQHTVDDMKGFENRLKDHLIQELPKGEASGIAGKVARVTVVTKQVPTVEDWDKLYAYIKKKNAFDLLNRALNVAACTERLEAGEQIPGIGAFTRVDVSCQKV
jgi:hypothetical protein